MNRLILTSVLLVLCTLTACGDNEAEEMEARRLEAARVEIAQLDAIRMQAEQARLEQEASAKREGQARKYARRAGNQIMEAIGGGQDLIINHRLNYFDPTARTLEIAMEVSFNGSIVRSNNYQLSGVLTVDEDGRNPKFARRAANENYTDMENTRTGLVIFAVVGVLMLADMDGD